MEETKVQKIVTENPDSLEIGTPSKGGAIKVYGNFSDKEIFRAKIDNALELRTYANSKIQ
jgi:hypothetical protein